MRSRRPRVSHVLRRRRGRGSARTSGTAPPTLVGVLFAAATLVVLALLRAVRCAPGRRRPGSTASCCLLDDRRRGAGRVAGDLITLIVALETLTLPLYVLVGLRRRSLASAEAAVTFFVVSVVSTAVTLLGAALLYARHRHRPLRRRSRTSLTEPARSCARCRWSARRVVLVLVGLAFKVAAVPFHAWAPATYDGAPLPVAAYLSTASKLGGVIALRAGRGRRAAAAAGRGRAGAGRAGGADDDRRQPGRAAPAADGAPARLVVGGPGRLHPGPAGRARAGVRPLGGSARRSWRPPWRTPSSTSCWSSARSGRWSRCGASADGGDLDDYRGAARRRPWVSRRVRAGAGRAGRAAARAGRPVRQGDRGAGAARRLAPGGSPWSWR